MASRSGARDRATVGRVPGCRSAAAMTLCAVVLLVLGVWHDRVRGRSDSRRIPGAPTVVEHAPPMV